MALQVQRDRKRRGMKGDRWLNALSTSLAIVAILAGAITLAWTRRAGSLSDAALGRVVSLKGAALLGSKDARVSVVVFSDFECSACIDFSQATFIDLKKEFIEPGVILFAFRHLPSSGHPAGQRAATAASCAGQQGRFWTLHDQLFRTKGQFDDYFIYNTAVDAQLDIRMFEDCLSGEASGVVADLALAKQLDLQATPTFLVGRIEAGDELRITAVQRGLTPIEQFRKMIGEAGSLGKR